MRGGGSKDTPSVEDTESQDVIINDSLAQIYHQGIPNMFNTQCYISAALQTMKSMQCFTQVLEKINESSNNSFIKTIIELFKELDSHDGSEEKKNKSKKHIVSCEQT